MTKPRAPKQRRAADPLLANMQTQIDHLHECIESVKKIGAENATALAENTELTKQVRDILGTFKVVGAVGKWIAAVMAAGVALYHAWQRVTGR